MELLSCPLCLKPHFQGVDELRSSLITVATSQISCPVCNEILMGLDKLTIHLFSHITHEFVRQHSISHPQPELEKSPRNSISEEPPCNVIQNSINVNNENALKESVEAENYSNLIEESILTIPKENPVKNNIRCDICNFYFSDENILDMHQKLLHQTQVDSVTGQSSYHCHLCSKKFKTRGSLMVHLRVAHFGFANQDPEYYMTKNNNNQINTKNNDKTDKSPEGKQWVCDVCSKQFTTKYFLKKHKRLHTGEMPYFCAQCNKSFTFQQSYHKHMLYHSSEKPHLCSECGRAFKELSTLHNHERIHSGERPFVCETCGKSFRQRVSYLVHRRIHTGAMPYKCTACDKSFRYKISQKSHKCPANPPGSVVRAAVLVEKLMENSAVHADAATNPDVLNFNRLDVNRGHDRRDSFSNNVFSQEPAQKYADKRFSIKQENEGNVVKNINSNILMTSNILANDVTKANDGHVNTIIFNSEGQIIGQNFAFDGQSIIAISPKLITNECDLVVNHVAETSNISKGNLLEKRTATDTQDIAETSKQTNQSNEFEQNNNNSKSPDFLSMVLSPMIPDVQSLCLTNSPTSEDCSVKQEPLETINEESFKSLLDGLSNCM